ncbi:MAG TPA: protein kinase [Pyrinomonadaceae bacterium]|nr:protein kinase [Pyrinomonadaceae bacterium]
MNCPRCQKEIPGDVSSCPACGLSFDDVTQRIEAPLIPSSKTGSKRPSPSFDSIDDARFVPGTILAERYRIVGLLGKGGMGEVYRADDLKLAQPVALKFLSQHLSDDEQAVARLYREVRIARQVSHPNVCRVYDIGEMDGQIFLSMEFIRGEELASLLRRIGRLPADKAVEIARQICAGLSAAHKLGVLHRDLKPANVMIDEQGNALLTDFGIAALAEEIHAEERAGTPAYMSPEQLAGNELTTRSDIYSLGLVLYEVFTGKKAFDAPTLGKLIDLRRSNTAPTTPSSLIQIDPLVERVILRCLEKDPAARPESALQVAAALPGGDPLAAALAAGETPSPEAVAAAPTRGLVSPTIALACVGATAVLLALFIFLAGKLELQNIIPNEKSPEVLADRAREINRRLGYTSPPVDTAQGFFWYAEILDYIKTHDRSPGRWDVLRNGDAPVLAFWYRQSPRNLIGLDKFSVYPANPPIDISGMTNTYLDSQGRLFTFIAVPQQLEEAPQAKPNWSILFAEAGLDMSSFHETEPRWTPPRYSDARAAWDGVRPGSMQLPIHIEAAAFHGKPIFFDVIFPWDRPYRQEEYQPSLKEKFKNWLLISLLAATVIGAALLGLRNIRLGRSDRNGAMRLAMYTFVISMIRGMLVAHHVPSLGGEFTILQEHLAWSLLWSITIWIVYLALEPFVRARWPHRIISWKRFISSDIRDPLVGRDIMLGVLVGIGIEVLSIVWLLSPRLFGLPTPVNVVDPTTLSGLRGQLGRMAGGLLEAPLVSLSTLFVLLLLSVILRRDWLATIAGWLLLIPLTIFSGDNPWLDIFFTALCAAIFILGLMRFGLLTAVFTFFSFSVLDALPVTTNFSAWFAGATFLVVVILLGLELYGAFTTVGGRSAFQGVARE